MIENFRHCVGSTTQTKLDKRHQQRMRERVLKKYGAQLNAPPCPVTISFSNSCTLLFSSEATLYIHTNVRRMAVCPSTTLGGNVIFSAPNWDIAPIFCVDSPHKCSKSLCYLWMFSSLFTNAIHSNNILHQTIYHRLHSKE